MKEALPAAGVALLVGFLAPAAFHGCGSPPEEISPGPVSPRSYQGHENDQDSDNLVGAYPALVGTRLDDCQTCHAGRMEEGRLTGSSCDRCHDLLLHGREGDAPRGVGSARETLNGFGRAYLQAGRTQEALRAIETRDSDGDGSPNAEEIKAGRYPGSSLSRPGQRVAEMITVRLPELEDLPLHRQFLLVNNTQQQFDDYVEFGGATLRDLFARKSIDLEGATGITVIAPDGYLKSLPIDLVEREFPQPIFHPGLDEGNLGPECGFVRYPEDLPGGVEGDSLIPGEQRMILAFQRNGVPLSSSTLDVAEGKIVGEGPLRLVVPQGDPGPPDRGSRFSPSGCGDGFDYDPTADHNAGSMVRGVIAIRIDPMPLGVEEFDYMNGGWAYVDAGQIIIYGHGVR